MQNSAPEPENEIERLMRSGDLNGVKSRMEKMTIAELKALQSRWDDKITTPEFRQGMDELAELAKTDRDAAELLKLEQEAVRQAQQSIARGESRREFGAKIRRLFGR
jgi:hypothetical protein